MGFYRGYFAYINAYAPGTAVQWGTYELFKGIGWRVATWFETTMERPWQSSSQKETAVNACSGGIAATCAICANNPLEILRIRTQLLESRNKKDAETIKAGYWKLARKILQEEGWQAFYRGLRVRLMVTVPSAMVALSGYEAIKTWSADS